MNVQYTERDVQSKESKEYGVLTKYFKTVVFARLEDMCHQEPRSPAVQMSVSERHHNYHASHRHHQAVQQLIQNQVYFLRNDDRPDRGTLYAWIKPEELDLLSSSIGEQLVSEWANRLEFKPLMESEGGGDPGKRDLVAGAAQAVTGAAQAVGNAVRFLRVSAPGVQIQRAPDSMSNVFREMNKIPPTTPAMNGEARQIYLPKPPEEIEKIEPSPPEPALAAPLPMPTTTPPGATSAPLGTKIGRASYDLSQLSRQSDSGTIVVRETMNESSDHNDEVVQVPRTLASTAGSRPSFHRTQASTVVKTASGARLPSQNASGARVPSRRDQASMGSFPLGDQESSDPMKVFTYI